MKKRERDYKIRHNKSPTDLGHCNLEEIRNRRKREKTKNDKQTSSNEESFSGKESSRKNLDMPITKKERKRYTQSSNALNFNNSDRSVSRSKRPPANPSERNVKIQKEDQDDYTLATTKKLAFREEYYHYTFY